MPSALGRERERRRCRYGKASPTVPAWLDEAGRRGPADMGGQLWRRVVCRSRARRAGDWRCRCCIWSCARGGEHGRLERKSRWPGRAWWCRRCGLEFPSGPRAQRQAHASLAAGPGRRSQRSNRALNHTSRLQHRPKPGCVAAPCREQRPRLSAPPIGSLHLHRHLARLHRAAVLDPPGRSRLHPARAMYCWHCGPGSQPCGHAAARLVLRAIPAREPAEPRSSLDSVQIWFAQRPPASA